MLAVVYDREDAFGMGATGARTTRGGLTRFAAVPLRASALAALISVACGGDSSGGDNQVFFVGYVYDGASGARLDKSAITKVGILYGDTQIKVDVQDDGRFISRDPLPTWRDYTVSIDATGYRSFVSYNTGVDVPASLAMTNGVAQASTTQTLDFTAYVFPVTLKSPALTLTVTVPDALTSVPTSSKVNGTMRLRPQGPPSVQVGGPSVQFGSPANRLWSNDEDLLTQTVVKTFTDGTVNLDPGELVYGVAYEVSVFDVAGFQPFSSGNSSLVAGTVSSRTFALLPDMKDPLSIVVNDATACVPPLGSDTSYGGKVTLTFNAPIELVGATYREDFDNLLSITFPSAPSGSPSVLYCPLKSSSSTDPTTQERGSKIEVSGASLIFSFNPSVGLATTYFGSPCMAPPTITTVTYGGASSLTLQPVGDPARRRSLSDMLIERRFSSAVTCPVRSGF
jgi:hypothetical protein